MLLSTVQTDTGEIINHCLDFRKLLNIKEIKHENCQKRGETSGWRRLPKVIEHRGDKTRELSKERRDKWLAKTSESY